ncbi:MAG: Holliday junction branch migration protein RuvA [Candidatus Pacebacteria bacterium]|nr:Holliday junction branch migration protein RuvA [Candidatus Paceibacterota bacterium]MCF7862432.1 Holliday junction branch migration protein RuvA [Candidatus Paceibacterota bacterium]
MIGSIRGKIIFEAEKYVIVETGGVGYKIFTINNPLLNKNTESHFWIYTHAREDALDLYGFPERKELGIFELLLNVSGIGPKSALGILAIASSDTLIKAISTGDTAYLTKVSGIGRKTAEKIVLELRDKMKDDNPDHAYLQEEIDTLEALKSLGYGQNEAREALKNIPSEDNTNLKIKKALKILGGK